MGNTQDRGSTEAIERKSVQGSDEEDKNHLDKLQRLADALKALM